MSAYADWCNEELQNEENKTAVLSKIHNLLDALAVSELKKVLSSIELRRVFDQLKESPTAEQAGAACDILGVFIERVDLGERQDLRMEFIEQALNSPFSQVRLKALLRIKKDIRNEEFLVELSKNKRIMTSIITDFANTECSIFQQVCAIIRLIGRSPFGIKRLLKKDTKILILEISKDDFAMMRIYETLVEICYLSVYSFHAIKSAGLLDCLIDGINGSDIQLRLNVLKLLRGLGASDHGFEYLEARRVLKKAYINFEDEVFLKLGEPAIIDLFGSMACRNPQDILPNYPNYLKRLVANLESKDLTIFDISLRYIGHIAFKFDGKLAFAAKGDLMPKIIKTVMSRMLFFSSDNQKTVLQFFCQILRVTEPSKKQVVFIANQWFLCIGDNPTAFIVKYIKLPIPELRFVGWQILRAIANQLWGQEAIKYTPGLVEFLLDRNSENDKSNKQVKYEIVRSLGASPIFKKTTTDRLIQYVIQESSMALMRLRATIKK